MTMEDSKELQNLNSYVQARSYLVDLLSIEMIRAGDTGKLTSKQFQTSVHSKEKDELNKLLAEICKIKHLCKCCPVPEPEYIRKKHKSHFRILLFLNRYINEYKAKLSKMKSRIKETIHLICHSKMIPPGIIVTLRIQPVYQRIRFHKKKLIALKNYYTKQIVEFERLENGIILRDDCRTLIRRIINAILPSFDEQLMFFCPSPYQDVFEEIIGSPSFGLHSLLTNLLKNFEQFSSGDFMNGIVEITTGTGKEIGEERPQGLSILAGLFIRYVFDAVYPRVRLFTLNELSTDIVGELSHLKIKDVGPPSIFTPGMKPDDNVREKFSHCDDYSMAIYHIEYTHLYTNPLDILHHMHHCLHEIEKTVASLSGETAKDNSLLSFDTVFALLLSCILASDIPDFMRVAMFAAQYAPSGGLSPDFEFALTKLNAVSIHMQNLIQDRYN